MAEPSTEWYRKSGHLTLFCRDLSWLNTETGRDILNALKARACRDGLTLYLKELNDVANALRKAGAIIYQIVESPSTKHHLSTFKSDGIMELIIRNKDCETSEVVSIEINTYSDPYLASLLSDMLHHFDS